jgi:hypothetical protein
LLPIHGAIDVVGITLVVATGAKGQIEIDTFSSHNRTGGIKKMALVTTGEGPQLVGQGL